MKKVKFEKMNDAKFQKLEIDKMEEVKIGLKELFCGPTVGAGWDTKCSNSDWSFDPFPN